MEIIVNRFRKLSTLLLLTLGLTMITACGGGGDDIPPQVNSGPTSSHDGAVLELCNTFGINPDDYYNYWVPETVGDKVIVSLARKKDNHVFVAIYDMSKKAVVYRNSDIVFTQTISVSSYDTKFNGKLANIYPRYGETKDGFVLIVLAFYTENGEVSLSSFDKALCMQTLLFNDGSTTRIKSFEATERPYVSSVKWFDNSCLLRKQYEDNACYSVKGDLLWENKPINHTYQGILCSMLSSDEYILFTNEYDKISVGRYDVRKALRSDPVSVWFKDLNLIDNFKSDIKVELTIEDSKSSVWTLSAKLIWENGTTKTVRFTLNIETGEYAIL